MPTSAGNVEIDFNAATAKLTAGVDGINRKLDEFGAKTEQHGGALDGMFSKFAGAELAVAAIEKVGEVALETARKMGEIVARTIEVDTHMVRLAQSLGTTASAFMTAQAAITLTSGKEAGEGFAKSLEHMSEQLAEATTKGGPAKDAINALGLDIGKLASEDKVAAFNQIRDALSEVGDAGNRIQLGKEIFPKRMLDEMLPSLTMSKTEFEAAAKFASDYNVSLSDIDAKKVADAGVVVGKLEEAWKGVENSLTVAVSPVLEQIGEDILALLPKGNTMVEFFQEGISFIGAAIGNWLDMNRLVAASILQVSAFLGSMGIRGAEAIDQIIKPLAKLGEHIPGVGKFVKAAQDEIEKGIAGAHASVDAENALAEKFFNFGSVADKIQDYLSKAWSGKPKGKEPEKPKFDPSAYATTELQKLIATQEQETQALLTSTAAAKINLLVHQGAPAALAAEAMARDKLNTAIKGHAKALEDVQSITAKMNATVAAGNKTGEAAEVQTKQAALLQATADQLRASLGAIGNAGHGKFLDTLGQQAGITGKSFATAASAIWKMHEALTGLQQANINKSLDAMDAKVSEAEAKMKGVSEVQKMVDEFIKQNPTATPAQISKAREKATTIVGDERILKIADEAKKLAEEMEEPFDKWKRQTNEISEALHRGAINADVAAKAKAKLDEEFAKATDKGAGGAMVRRFDFNMPAGRGGSTPQEKAATAATDAARAAEQAAATLAGMGGWLRDLWNKIYNNAGGASDDEIAFDLL